MYTFTEVTIFVGLIITIILYVKYLASPLLKGAPYVPISKSNLDMLIELSGAEKGDFVVDLGSGDGRVVTPLPKKGVR